MSARPAARAAQAGLARRRQRSGQSPSAARSSHGTPAERPRRHHRRHDRRTPPWRTCARASAAPCCARARRATTRRAGSGTARSTGGRADRALRGRGRRGHRGRASPASTACRRRSGAAATASLGPAVRDDGVMIDLSLMKARLGRPRRPDGARRGRPHVVRVRPCHPAVRPRHDGRLDQPHRDRRGDPGRRLRPSHAPARADRGQPARGGRGHRDGRAGAGGRRVASPSCCGGCAAAAATSASSRAFEYDLHPVGPMVYGGPIFWPLDQAPACCGSCGTSRRTRPDELGIAIVANLAPPMPFLPPESLRPARVRPAARLVGRHRRRYRATEPLRSLGTPLGDASGPCPTARIQSLLDGGAPPGNHAYWRSHRLPRLTDAVIDAIVARVETITSPLSLLNGWVIGGAASRVDRRTRPRSANARTATSYGVSRSGARRHRRREARGLGARGLGGAAAAHGRPAVRQLPVRRGRRRRHRGVRRPACTGLSRSRTAGTRRTSSTAPSPSDPGGRS